MKITLIINHTYQTEKELHRCLDTVKLQTAEDVQVILVGAAVDGCICTDNMEQARGLASGEYCAVIGSDCRLSPLFCEKMTDMCTEHGTDIALCGYMETGADTPLEQIAVPLMLYPVEVTDKDTVVASDKGFNKIVKTKGADSTKAAATRRPLIFITQSTERG